MMKTSIIVTTYNWPEALRACLLSFEKQSIKPLEIVLADDGSRDDTLKCINQVRAAISIPIAHAWQEDQNFRAARARNLAVKKSAGDYLIFVDGDMIAHKKFVEDHIKSAKKNQFLQGSRCLLSPSLSQQILKTGNHDINFFTSGIENRKNALRLPALAPLVVSQTDPLKGIRTCNLSLFRSDFEKINGFDNQFIGWGREDSEFAARLKNSGIKRKDIKFKALAYHIYHKENSRESLKDNHDRLMNTINNSVTYASNGYKEV